MTRNNLLIGLTLVACCSLVPIPWAAAQSPAAQTPGQILREAGFDQRIGESIPADAVFRDSSGRARPLKDYLGKKPILLALVYYECPMLCTLELNGLVRSLKALPLDVGDDFLVLTVSFDPGETPQLAARKRANYLEQYGRPTEGWFFLTGQQEPIDRLCSAVGFRPVYDPQRDEYAHASGLVLLTPDGTISRYYFGIDYPARDLRLGLTEASAGKLGTLTDHLLLLCYSYDPATGKYGLMIMNVIRLGGVVTLVLLGGFIAVSIYRDRRSENATTDDSAASDSPSSGI